MNYYISDLHLFHEKVLEKSGRPFSDTKEMADFIAENWNEAVSNKDTVYVLGDVGHYHSKEIVRWLNHLPGKKVLIIGNHDTKALSAYKKAFQEITPYKEISDKGRMVVLSHYPFEEWDGYYRGYYHIHGHIHENPNHLPSKNRRFNASVDVTGFCPVTLDWLEENRRKKH